MARKRCVWLLRAKNHTTVSFEEQKQTCAQIANPLSFNKRREVSYQGKAQWQWVAEASIVITRGASVRKNQKRTTVRRSTFSGQQSDVRYGRKFGAMAVDNQRANR